MRPWSRIGQFPHRRPGPQDAGRPARGHLRRPALCASRRERDPPPEPRARMRIGPLRQRIRLQRDLQDAHLLAHADIAGTLRDEPQGGLRPAVHQGEHQPDAGHGRRSRLLPQEHDRLRPRRCESHPQPRGQVRSAQAGPVPDRRPRGRAPHPERRGLERPARHGLPPARRHPRRVRRAPAAHVRPDGPGLPDRQHPRGQLHGHEGSDRPELPLAGLHRRSPRAIPPRWGRGEASEAPRDRPVPHFHTRLHDREDDDHRAGRRDDAARPFDGAVWQRHQRWRPPQSRQPARHRAGQGRGDSPDGTTHQVPAGDADVQSPAGDAPAGRRSGRSFRRQHRTASRTVRPDGGFGGPSSSGATRCRFADGLGHSSAAWFAASWRRAPRRRTGRLPIPPDRRSRTCEPGTWKLGGTRPSGSGTRPGMSGAGPCRSWSTC